MLTPVIPLSLTLTVTLARKNPVPLRARGLPLPPPVASQGKQDGLPPPPPPLPPAAELPLRCRRVRCPPQCAGSRAGTAPGRDRGRAAQPVPPSQNPPHPQDRSSHPEPPGDGTLLGLALGRGCAGDDGGDALGKESQAGSVAVAPVWDTSPGGGGKIRQKSAHRSWSHPRRTPVRASASPALLRCLHLCQRLALAGLSPVCGDADPQKGHLLPGPSTPPAPQPGPGEGSEAADVSLAAGVFLLSS